MVLFHLVYQRVFQTLQINIWANFPLAYHGKLGQQLNRDARASVNKPSAARSKNSGYSVA